MENKVLKGSLFTPGKGLDFGKLQIEIDRFNEKFGNFPSVILSSELVYKEIEKTYSSLHEEKVTFFGTPVVAANTLGYGTLYYELH